jgi:soluble lytic murein transglycosylase-like protein
MSEFQIEYNRAKTNGWLPLFQAAAAAHDFPPELLMGIASRETNMKDIKGDFQGGIYHGYSLMQIDIGTDPTFCKAWRPNVNVDQSIERGAQILASKRDYLRAHGYADLKDIAAAYNTGERNVVKSLAAGRDSDLTTTGHNYGSDVMARSAAFKLLLDADTVATSTSPT